MRTSAAGPTGGREPAGGPPSNTAPTNGRLNRSRQGQSLLEPVFVVLLACLCLLAVFQYAHLFACKTVLSHAAARTAQGRLLGLIVALIPGIPGVATPLLKPGLTIPSSNPSTAGCP